MDRFVAPPRAKVCEGNGIRVYAYREATPLAGDQQLARGGTESAGGETSGQLGSPGEP